MEKIREHSVYSSLGYFDFEFNDDTKEACACFGLHWHDEKDMDKKTRLALTNINRQFHISWYDFKYRNKEGLLVNHEWRKQQIGEMLVTMALRIAERQGIKKFFIVASDKKYYYRFGARDLGPGEEMQTHFSTLASYPNMVVDFAQVSDNHQTRFNQKGGIDLTPANMNVEIKKEIASSPSASSNDTGIQFHLTPAMLAQLQNAPGFVPVIISIQPMMDLKSFLGIKDESSAIL